MSAWRWIRRRGWGLATGMAVTLLAIAAYLAGWLEPLESSWLDYLFRHANRIEADPRIVLVDINDAALERIHRWPWPRRLQADLVDVLHECHAGAVLLDLVYTEPTPREIRHPALEPEYAVDRPAEILGDVSMQDAIDGDRELADAIARAGNVYVAMYFRMSAPGHDPEELRSRSRQLLDENPGASLEEYARAIGRPADDALRSLYDQARVDHLLRDDFGLEVEAVAARLRLPPKDVELFFSDAKEKAARLLVDRFLDQRPAAAFPEVLASLLPGRTAQADSPDRRDLLRAYWRYTAARHILQRATPFDPLRHGRLPVGTDLAVPIEAIARAARGVGFVTFEKDADGVVRHLPLWAVVERRVVPQLGFALACDVLDIDLAAVRFPEVGVLTMTDRSGAHEWRIPLDDQGRMLLNWHIDRAAPSWERSFQHVPVARVAEVALNRRVIEDNRARLALRTAEAVALMYEGATSAYLDYEAKVRRWNELCRAHRNGVGASPTASRPVDGAAQPAQIEALRAELDAVEQTALRHLARLAAEVGDLAPADDRERELFPRIRRLHRELADGSLAATLDAQNEALLRRNEQLLAELEARIGGRLCLVGHVAAAQADMVNTPVFANMPGVMAHANLINTLLQNRIPRVVSRAVTVLLILVTGLLITLLASTRGPWVTLASVVLVMGPSLAVSMLLMWRSTMYLAAVVPAGAVFVCWAAITLYRQLTEERQRRSLARELARNTSPAIAARITEQLDDLDLTPCPADVTCYFSDLQGFTTISERLGVEATQTVLNRYLGEMGELLVGRRAFNKFMGDGIFAFFNAPIWPQADHAAVGCEAALETLQRLRLLQDAAVREHSPYAGEFRNLRVRIGLHTGPVFVGYFGSDNQTDYTCIGDTVNLAARLEGANKAFGTWVLVSGACRDVVGDRFVFRSLGELQVKGKVAAVPVHELLGRAGEVAPEDTAYAARFASAVGEFQARRWDQAEAAFRRCLADHPADAAAGVYLEETRRLRVTPPPPDWNRAIELASK